MPATQLQPRGESSADLFAKQQSLFDEDGFLIDPAQWNEALAESTALLDGIGELGEDHWRVIHHVRDRFQALGGMPSMRRVCRATGLSREDIYGLFGSCLRVWRIAGLPNPGEEARSYM